jgi:hypothetical protein
VNFSRHQVTRRASFDSMLTVVYLIGFIDLRFIVVCSITTGLNKLMERMFNLMFQEYSPDLWKVQSFGPA